MSDRPVWHQDDSFWRAMWPLFFGPRHWADAPREAQRALELLGLAGGACVLDLGCGPGRHSLAMARLGGRVTGVDRTACYLDEARRRAAAERLDVEFVLADMRSFVRPGAFDGVASLSTSFGYFDDPSDDRRVLQNVRRSLRDGGRLVMELLNRGNVVATFSSAGRLVAEDGTVYEERRSLEDDATWLRKHRTVVVDGRAQEFVVTHRLYAPEGLVALLRDCGFGSVRTYGSLDASPLDARCERIVAVASA
jgi:SAM-dependent methyltransferase